MRVGNIENKKLLFEVEDTGIGIPPEKIDLIFDSFQQLETGMSKSKGTGLGLSISRNLARLMGSDLFVRSEVGKGSTFWFFTPFTPINNEYITFEPLTFENKGNKELDQNIPVPPREELKALFEMTRIGDIISIRKQIERWESSNPEWGQFTTRLKILAKNINLVEIKNLIKEFLEE